MKKSFILVGLMLSAFNSYAEVSIEVPDTIQILAVNQQAPKLEGHFFASQKNLTLADGENQIVFRYRPYFDKGSEQVIVESKVIIARFHATKENLRFELPHYRDIDQAQEAIADLQWRLLNQDNHPIELTQDRLIKEGIQIGRDYVLEVKAYNQNGGKAAVLSKPLTGPDNSVEQALHYWYQQADADTRQKFKAFINQQ
ncbi:MULTISPECIES: DUF2057 family protein [unclassified Vibrio]|uniref:UPF0319 protein AB0763_14870 n=1 Tax=Vibrio sp. HB236076 TaxID=3232307 RepID=A0AB39HLX4_9VIBR|nr:DUF2057 family protein [Vibrio sp. HB161653]MDP5252607.1 DUF2057 family protein [Vibrio sp. HB161653]